jgi:hypothetical protein
MVLYIYFSGNNKFRHPWCNSTVDYRILVHEATFIFIILNLSNLNFPGLVLSFLRCVS